MAGKAKTVAKLTTDTLSLETLRAAYRGPAMVILSAADRKKIEAAHKTVADVLKEGRTVYGINTGFGILARTKIAPGKLELLQKKLVLSHMAGIGKPLPDNVVRLVLALKCLSLAKGYSGVSLSLVEALSKLLEAEVYPIIPEKGSVGASGDLAPLAHLSGVLMGLGEVRQGGKTIPAAEGLSRAGLKPMRFGPKEGLALLNGTQVSTALALAGLFEIEKVFAAAVAAGALSVDAVKGSDAPFDARIHETRGQLGQIRVARHYQRLLAGSAIRASHADCERVQDPYSLRCQPQVMGACLDMIDYAAAVLFRESNAVSDNPLIFPDNGDVISGGNFHGQPVAFAADVLALAVSEIGSMSERRIALLMDDKLSGLPAFLVPESGLNSGFMIVQVTAAALASENKQMSHPASVDSIPTSANQEDHVSMATFAARRLLGMADNTAGIVAIELLAAAQGIDLVKPLKTSDTLARVHSEVRKAAAFVSEDRPFTPDIERAKDLIAGPFFSQLLPDLLSKGSAET
ncbi:MAG: histidine ammonia-lyase [Proteobacteria bacterium]|nr:histidine ammonia-lyase [Pseudomonadota bacterium]